MANFCSRCGKPLEKDGFCMNCMDFARKSGNIQGTATDYQAEAKIQYSTDLVEENTVQENTVQGSNQTESMIQGDIQINRGNKTRTSASRLLLATVLSIGICVAGILIITKFADAPDKGSFVDSKAYTDDASQETAPIDSVEDGNFDEAQDDVASAFDESNEVYEADYDEIMQAGEPSNGYNLYSIKKEDIVPVMDEYFSMNDIQTTFSSSMDNSFEMVDDEKITYYETYSMWQFDGEESAMYCVASDTVTSNILYVGVCLEDKTKAIELVKESLLTIDPSLSEEQLQTTCGNMAAETDLVQEDCGDYYVYGGYTGTEQNMYYYYIFSLVEN